MAIPRTVPARSGPVGEFFTGVGLLFRGFGLVGRSPGLLLLGLVPGVIAAVIVAGGLFALVYFSGDLASLVTWFAAHWSAELRDLVRTLAQIALVAVSILVAVLTFTALTLTIGDPFYEALSKRIDDRFGGVPGMVEQPWYRTFGRNLADSTRMIALSVIASVFLFGAGLIPVVGQTVVPVIDAAVGGWFLAVEISGVPFNRRGLRLRDRRRLLGAHRALALGFGVPLFLLFLVPFAAIVVMPGAVAGATLMTRRVLGQAH